MNPAESNASGQDFSMQRFYLKDLSFEAPDTPNIFKQQWKPELNLELHTHSEMLEASVYEVVLSGTVTVKLETNVAFLVEAKYAGIFIIQGFTEAQLSELLGSICPNMLFPYLREVISSVVDRASFPQLILAPVNFNALYMQHLQQQQEAKETAN